MAAVATLTAEQLGDFRRTTNGANFRIPRFAILTGTTGDLVRKSILWYGVVTSTLAIQILV